MVKQRSKGRVIGTKLRVIYGDQEEVVSLLGQSTAYIERSHLTTRMFNSRLPRQTLVYSKQVEMYRASAAWEDVGYNLGRPHQSLRSEVFDDDQRRWQCPPAMAAKLTDHIWSVEDLLTTIAGPNT